MPEYEIEVYEIHVSKCRIKAKNEAEAIDLLNKGGAEWDDDAQEYMEPAEDLGLCADEYPELVDALNELGWRIKDTIPSIRSIREI